LKAAEEAGARSLLMEVVDWMLAPLAVIWPVAIAVSYALGMSIADGPFDRELRDRVIAVADELASTIPGGRTLPPSPTLIRIRADATDRTYAQVVDERGRDLAGDAFLPAPAEDACSDDDVRFRNAHTEEGELRLACRWVRLGGQGARVLVQVAEPLDRRADHARQVTVMVMTVVMLLVPFTVVLVGFGIWRGLAPVRRLSAGIEARSPTDVSPLPVEGAPLDVVPLLRTLNRQLERVRANLEGQRRFVADAAHQLRTPLAALKTQAQVGQTRTPAEAHERLGNIVEGMDHLSRLASQLLALARADEAHAHEASEVELGAALRVVCHDLADAAIAKSLRLGLDVPEDGVRVAGDAGLLHELFVNLLDNAIRYTPAGGEIEVRARAGAAPVVEVEDSGPGIPEAERERVFERFYRVLGSGVPGSGLGLPIVRSIAARHGATVELGSGRGGHGTLVRVTFHPRVNP
jgi:two-component system sensor histidine kinase TctE